jgi:hypothetical protein
MQDPKIKDRGCLTDGCDRRAIEGKYCPSCTLKNIKSKRVSKFISFKIKRKNNNLQKQINKQDKANKLWNKCLTLWSEIVRGNEEYAQCETCQKVYKTKNGIYGLHAGHYYPKAKYWKLSLELNNGVRQCPKCNVIDWFNPYKAESLKLELRTAVKKRYGTESLLSLEIMAEEFIDRLNKGLENTKPRVHDPLANAFGRKADMEFLEEKKAYLEHMLSEMYNM